MITEEDIRSDFDHFYAAVHSAGQDADRATPYEWQRRLLSQVLKTGKWPERVSAPTGSGKTCVVDIHVFLNAIAGEAKDNPDYSSDLARKLDGLPRRLALLAPRRSLVDDQSDLSARLQEMLVSPRKPVLERVRDGLLKRAGTELLQEREAPPALLVDTVRGGEARKRYLGDDAWQTHPTYCALIHMTPDMFGSALLFRHYGASRKRRPQDAGLLGVDTVAVIDEAHLQRQLLFTAKRVADLEQRASERPARPLLQVVETTATPDTDVPRDDTVSVLDDDLVADDQLAARLQAAKKLSVVPLGSSLGRKNNKAAVNAVVSQMLQLHEAAEREAQELGCDVVPPVGFVANTVRSALDVTAALEAAVSSTAEVSPVFSVVGRMRPVDRLTDLEASPGVLTPDGNRDKTFIVSTQTLEVGVDLDLFGLVTELASPSALAQRAGRLNRRGRWNKSEMVVLDQESSSKGPYTDSELSSALTWLDQLGGDASPWSIHSQPAQPPELKRRALQRLEVWDAEHFAASSEALAAEISNSGVELWTRDSFDESLDVSIVTRGLPPDDAMAARVLELRPPNRLEMLPAPLGAVPRALEAHLTENEKVDSRFARFFIWDPIAKKAVVKRAGPPGQGFSVALSPGAIVVVDSTAPIFRARVFDDEGGETLPDVSAEAIAASTANEETADTKTPVLISRSTGDAAGWQQPYQALDENASVPLLSALAEALAEGEDLGTAIAPLLAASTTTAPLTQGRLNVVVDDPVEPTQAIVLASQTGWDADEATYEAGSRKPVLLETHQKKVAERGGALASALGLSERQAKALTDAALLHDEGKRDLRFQAVLRLRSELDADAPALAKSTRRSVAREKQIRSMYELSGWRHELLSAAFAQAHLEEGPEKDLTLRLIGTSHGFGRACCDSDSAHLVRDDSGVSPEVAEAAAFIFDTGVWESVVERTHRRHGYWGAAFMEALLRAADGTVSGEGS